VQPTLFDLSPTAPWSHHSTSRDAAQAIAPHLNRLAALMLSALRACPATADELERATGLAGNTVRPRLWELRRRELVVDSGLTRRTPSGRKAIVWRCA
jgi:hypothetical protein